MGEEITIGAAVGAWLGELIDTTLGKIAISIIAAVIATLLVRFALAIWRHSQTVQKLKNAHKQALEEQSKLSQEALQSTQDELKRIQERLSLAERAVDGEGLWLARPPSPPSQYAERLARSIPIVTIANLKGGVGKTTITSNLAWYFGSKGKRVLAIDLDFQGSLSSLAPQSDGHRSSHVSRAVLGDLRGEQLIEIAWPMSGVPKANILSAYYELAGIENKAMVHWLTQREERDVRYFLADVLLDPVVQDRFDVVLIDAPPRLTTGAVQALAASTHLLIPTVLDTLSSDAVTFFVEQFFINRRIWPFLKIAGVVGSMTQNNVGALTQRENDRTRFAEHEDSAIQRIQDRCEAVFSRYEQPIQADLIFPFRTFIADKAGFGRAAESGVASVAAPSTVRGDIQGMFDRLGQELARRVNMRV